MLEEKFLPCPFADHLHLLYVKLRASLLASHMQKPVMILLLLLFSCYTPGASLFMHPAPAAPGKSRFSLWEASTC